MKVIVILSFILLTACSSQNKKLLEDDLPTMKEVYQNKFNTHEGLGRQDVDRSLKPDDRDLNSLVREEIKPLRREFRYLPNPTLTMYIYPHLTDAGSPVPGYATFFKFYEKDHIGLPNEFPPRVSSKRFRDLNTGEH